MGIKTNGNGTNGKAGRPKIEIDFKELEKLCRLQCSETEIADWFKCSIYTLKARIREVYNMDFQQYFQKHRVEGKIALRRLLFKHAEKHPSMAIFLAKNWLGMSERTEISGEGGGPVKHEITVVSDNAKKLTEEILNGKGTE